MKSIKRCFLTLLTVVMTLVSINAVPVFAAEVTDDDMHSAVNGIAITSTPVDNTFTMGSYHRGGDRAYSTNRLYVKATITDSNGNAVNNNVTIILKDYNGNSTYWSVAADGTMYTNTFSIVAGRVYYFEYYRSGTARNLKVHMIINPV